MACARSRVLLNPAERRLLDKLRELVDPHHAEVWCKVGLKDAVDLNNSGISTDHYAYAMRAHLDFVVTDRDSSRILFAVEYDGAEHFTDADTIQRDRKKTDVCRALGFDLLRVTKCQLETVFLGRSQLQLLVEQWFEVLGCTQAMPMLAVVGARNFSAPPAPAREPEPQLQSLPKANSCPTSTGSTSPLRL